jgi:hypothetical protein
MHHHPYLIEYPKEIIYSKIKYMTELLEDIFNIKMKSHRAGRWAFNNYYAKVLSEFGYSVDSSVTPGFSWENHPGVPNGRGGTNYNLFLSEPYFMNLDNIRVKGDSTLLEVPVTILPLLDYLPKYGKSLVYLKSLINKRFIINRYIYSLIDRKYPDTIWLRPNGRNLNHLIKVITHNNHKNDYIQFMLHSSELMPGGSHRFPDTGTIEKLYSHIEKIFELINKNYKGVTLSEYHNEFMKSGHKKDI